MPSVRGWIAFVGAGSIAVVADVAVGGWIRRRAPTPLTAKLLACAESLASTTSVAKDTVMAPPTRFDPFRTECKVRHKTMQRSHVISPAGCGHGAEDPEVGPDAPVTSRGFVDAGC